MPPRCPRVKPLLAVSASVAAGRLAFACSRQGSHHSVLILNKQRLHFDLEGTFPSVCIRVSLKKERLDFVLLYFLFSPLLI